MKRRIAIFLLCLLSLAGSAHRAFAAVDKPAKPAYVAEPMVFVPKDLREMFDQSSVVARVRILDSVPVLLEGNGVPGPRLLTKHTARVITTLKGEKGTGKTIEFYQTAGSFENERLSIRVAHQSVLLRDHDYVVFLSPYPYLKSLSLAFENNGAFEVTDRIIKPVGDSPMSKERDNMPLDRFLGEVRMIGGKAAK